MFAFPVAVENNSLHIEEESRMIWSVGKITDVLCHSVEQLLSLQLKQGDGIPESLSLLDVLSAHVW